MVDVYLRSVVTSWVLVDDAIPLTITPPRREHIDSPHYNSALQRSSLSKSDIMRTVREGDDWGLYFIANN